ncbi:MAG: choice-of-anchor D domain-containing protein [Acidobacteria bacterium]|nr:MAG: choice-of-anchor D domain-containing protein [Acidobacteriota bacterium]
MFYARCLPAAFFWAFVSVAIGIGLTPARACATSPVVNFGGVVVFQKTGAVPVAVARDASGNLYLADQANGEVIQQTPSGVQSVVASGLTLNAGGGAGLAVDASGNVYIGEANAVIKETPSGSTYTASTIASGYDGNAVAVDANGDVFVASSSGSGQVVEYTPNGSTYTARTIVSGNLTDGVGVDASGNIYLSYSALNEVVKLTPAAGGTYTQTNIDTTITAPGALVVDGAGDVYVIDTSFEQVTKEVPSGTSYSATAVADFSHNGLAQPLGLYVDTEGSIFVADGSLNLVLEFPALGVDFGGSAVGAATSAVTLRFYFTAGVTMGTPLALTGGVSGLDFTAAAGTCTGSFFGAQSCTMSASFKPSLAGLRLGAIELTDNTGVVQISVPVRGTGDGPQVAFGPGTATSIGGTLSTSFEAAVDGTGNVFVAVTGTAPGVYEDKLSGSRYTQTTIGTFINAPQGVAVDGAGNVYISDTGTSNIYKETPSGGGYTQTNLVPGIPATPGQIAVDAGGSIYVAYTTGVIRETPVLGNYVQSTVVTATLPQGGGLAVAGDGTVFAADPGQQAVLEAVPDNGAYTTHLLGVGDLTNPTGLTLDAAGNLYIYDKSTNQVTMLSAASGYTTATTAGTSNSQALAVDAKGIAYWEGTSAGQMERIDRRSAPTLNFGSLALGATGTSAFSLLNLGTLPLTFTSVSNPGSGFVASGCSAGTVANGSSCSETVTFSPQVLGAVAGNINFSDDDLGVSGSLQKVVFNGTGTAAPLTITASSATITLGTAIPKITPAYAGFVNGDTAASLTTAPTCSTTATNSSPAGVYPTTCNGAVDANYSFTYVSGTITITKLTVQTITFGALASVSYGAAPIALSASSSSGLAPAFSVVSGPATVAGTTLTVTGAGTVVVEAEQAGNSTYAAATPVQQSLTVTPAALKITGLSATVAQGAAIPAITPVYTGFVNGDTAASLTTAPTCTTTAKSGSPAGTYPTTCSGAVDANYAITYAPGAITISNLTAQTITFGALAGVTYGAAPITLSATSSSGLAPTFQLVSGPATVSGTTLTVTGAGTVVVEAEQAGNSTYAAAAPVSQSLTVAPAPLTITASSATINLGAAIPKVTPVYTGFVNGDTAAALTTAPACATTASSSSPAGTYPTTCSGAVDPNYGFSYVAGVLTISKLSLQTITFGPLAAVSYGAAPIMLSATSTSGLAPTFQILSGPATVAGSTLTVIGAGTVVVEAMQAGNSTYAAATPVSQSLVVAPAPLTITASSGTMQYGETPAVTPLFTGFVGGDTAKLLSTQPVCTTTATATSAPGTTAATACAGAADANYAISYVSGSITVTKATVTLVLTASASSIAAGVPITLTATATSSTPAVANGLILFTTSTQTGTLISAFTTGGQAIVNPVLNTLGTNTLQATFFPNTDFAGAASNTVQVQVAGAPGNAGFTMGINPTSINVAQIATTLTLTPTGNYAGIVALSCSGIPADMGRTCSFYTTPDLKTQSDSVTLDGTNTSVQRNLVFTLSTSQSGGFAWLGEGGSGSGRWVWVLLGLLGALLTGLRLLKSRKQRLAWSMIVAGVALAACGGLPPTPSNQTATITVTATGIPRKGTSFPAVTTSQQITVQY